MIPSCQCWTERAHFRIAMVISAEASVSFHMSAMLAENRGPRPAGCFWRTVNVGEASGFDCEMVDRQSMSAPINAAWTSLNVANIFSWRVGLGGSRLGALSGQRLPSPEMLHCTHFSFNPLGTMQRWRQERHRSGFASAIPPDMGVPAESCDVILQPDVVLWCGWHNDSYQLHATFQTLCSKRASNLRPWCRRWLMADCFTSHDFTAALVAGSTRLAVIGFFFFPCLSRVCDPWNWQRRVRTAESHTANSDGLSRKGVRRQYEAGEGGDNEGSLQFHWMSKIGFLLPVAHYSYSMRFHQSEHMRIERKTEWRKMSPELEK